jgi:hypothetical protein
VQFEVERVASTLFVRAQVSQRVGGNALHLSVPSFAHGKGFNGTNPANKSAVKSGREIKRP